MTTNGLGDGPGNVAGNGGGVSGDGRGYGFCIVDGWTGGGVGDGRGEGVDLPALDFTIPEEVEQ
jgi:hypothetical protein